MAHHGNINSAVRNNMGKNKKNPGSFRIFGRTINLEVSRGNLTSIGDTVNLNVKGAQKKYRLLPQGKIFICFSGNTSEDVHRVQNELLLENLDPCQAIEWIPMAWNVLTPINTIGTSNSAQDVINTYIQKADHIVFVVKDNAGEGLKIEWDNFSELSQNKTIHLFIYDNENRFKVHDELDPKKQITHTPYKDYKDILLYLRAKIHPKAILTGNEQKLHFVQTSAQMSQLQISIKHQLTVLKRENADPQIIIGMEKLIHTIDKKGPDILMKNKNNSLNQPVLIKVDSVIRPTHVFMPGKPAPQINRSGRVKQIKVSRRSKK